VASGRRFGALRRKAPQIIVGGIALAIVAYLSIEVLEDVLIDGMPLSSSPIVAAILTITRNVTFVVASWSYFGVFGLMLLESSSLPIPSEVVLPFAGYLVSMGQMNGWIALALATMAGIMGSLIDYYIGFRGVQSLFQHKILGKTILSPPQLETAGIWFRKYGTAALFFSRLMPGFRTIISFPAGAVKMKLPKFIAYTTAGCFTWSAVLIYVGYFLGKNWKEVAGVSHYLILASVSAVLVLITAYLVIRSRRIARDRKRINASAVA